MLNMIHTTHSMYIISIRLLIYYCILYILYFPQNKMNLFILSGHAGDSFAAFLNEVIL